MSKSDKNGYESQNHQNSTAQFNAGRNGFILFGVIAAVAAYWMFG